MQGMFDGFLTTLVWLAVIAAIIIAGVSFSIGMWMS